MDKTLRELYDSFYMPPEMPELTEAVETKRTLLRDQMATEDRNVVLRIIDDETSITGALSLDAFLCGLRLAWQLSNELNNLDKERSVLVDEAERSVHFLSDEEGDKA